MDDIDLEPLFRDVIQTIPQVGKFQSRQIRLSSLDELDLSLDRFNQGTFLDRIKAYHCHLSLLFHQRLSRLRLFFHLYSNVQKKEHKWSSPTHPSPLGGGGSG
jgi:hypothetical protein